MEVEYKKLVQDLSDILDETTLSFLIEKCNFSYTDEININEILNVIFSAHLTSAFNLMHGVAGAHSPDLQKLIEEKIIDKMSGLENFLGKGNSEIFIKGKKLEI